MELQELYVFTYSDIANDNNRVKKIERERISRMKQVRVMDGLDGIGSLW